MHACSIVPAVTPEETPVAINAAAATRGDPGGVADTGAAANVPPPVDDAKILSRLVVKKLSAQTSQEAKRKEDMQIRRKKYVQYSAVVDQIRSTVIWIDCQTCRPSIRPITRPLLLSHIADYWIAWRRRGTMQEEEETRSRTTLGSPSLPSPRHRKPLPTGNSSSSIHPSIID
jgi:hypothetical protein